MKQWVFLSLAIVSEVTAALSMQAAVDRPGWYALVVVGYLTAFVLLVQVLRAGMGVGVAYGIWGAAGVALTALFASVLFGQALTVPMLAGFACIAVGVLLIELGAQRAMAASKDRRS
ncbi:DMT family transporter [Curtobacterium flaccumfaciens]|uniref:DMT family transporter n=1 Tax=Curtobacterium flaccumfaciens TaxID=2035 RepID=UPI001E4826FF|nr:SMR family transporter [Curtobacterium allii]MCE0459468.1 QacE family quaternary ammonium compound efflux SMR transporter [Curtobacterium allii]